MTLEPLDRNANYTGKVGAEILAERIRQVWARRGVTVQVYVKPRSISQVAMAQFFDVRSYLVNGRPL